MAILPPQETRTPMTFDFTLMQELRRITAAKRDGSIVVDEATGRPYAKSRPQQQWRKVTDAAGVPRSTLTLPSARRVATARAVHRIGSCSPCVDHAARTMRRLSRTRPARP